jgi:hypothetical protein
VYIRSGPSIPDTRLRKVGPDLFKLSYRCVISGTYSLAIMCRKNPVKNSPFQVRGAVILH